MHVRPIDEETSAVLFLYRPRQTWMPFRPPQNLTAPGAYNREIQDRFDATRRVPPPVPTAEPARRDLTDKLKDLAELHRSGALSDDEFADAKAKVLTTDVSA